MKPVHHSAAFSLVEMMAAVVIFGLVVLGTLELFTSSLRAGAASGAHTRGVMLAQGMMEETLAEGNFMLAGEGGDFGADYEGYTWERQVTETDDPGLYQVEILVNWTEHGREKRYKLVTLAVERTEE